MGIEGLSLVQDYAKNEFSGEKYPFFLGFLKWAGNFRDETLGTTDHYRIPDPKAYCADYLSGKYTDTSIDWTELAPMIVKVLCMPKWDGLFGNRDYVHDKVDHIPPACEFTKLRICEIDQLKIAGVRKKTLCRNVVEFIENALSDPDSVPWDERFHEWRSFLISNTIQRFLQTRMDRSIGVALRAKQEVVLKPAKLLRVMYPRVSMDKISVVAGYLADALRERVEEISSNYELYTDLPSEVYHSPHSATLQSCMKGMDRNNEGELTGNSFELYDDLPHTEILVCKNKGYVIGRALLHKQVENCDTGETFGMMDRIYHKDAPVLAAFKIWAKKHGYMRKLEQKLHENNYVTPKGDIVHLPHLRLATHGIYEHDYEKVPYVDTFNVYIETDPEGLYSWQDEEDDRDICHCLTSTTGYDRDSFFTESCWPTCCMCGEGCRDDDYETDDEGNVYCRDCFEDSYAHCAEGCGRIICTDGDTDAEYIEDVGFVCPTCLRNHYTKCSACREYHSDNEYEDYIDENGKEGKICRECRKDESVCITCEHDDCGTLMHPKAATLVNDGRYKRDWCPDCAKYDAKCCVECDEYFPDHLCTKADNGDWYCDDCYDDLFNQDDEEDEEDDAEEDDCEHDHSKMWHRCQCKVGRKNCNGDELYTSCIEGSGVWNACTCRNERILQGLATVEVWKLETGKPLKCWWCGSGIPMDAQGYTYAIEDTPYVTDGKAVKKYYHPKCHEAMKEIFKHKCHKCQKNFAVIYDLEYTKDGEVVKEKVCYNCLNNLEGSLLPEQKSA